MKVSSSDVKKRDDMESDCSQEVERPMDVKSQKDPEKLERAPGVAGLILAALVAFLILTSHSTLKQFGTQSDSVGSWFIPWLSVAGIALGSILLLLRRHLWQGEDHSSDDTGSLRSADIWVGLGSLLVYVWVMQYLGFYLDTAFLLFEFAFLFRLRIRSTIAVGVAMELFAYLLFVRLLHVLLPLWPT